MNFDYAKTYTGKGKILIIILGILINIFGLFSYYDSHWKKINENNWNDLSEWDREGRDVPSITTEKYFVFMIIACFILSLFSLGVSMLIDMTRGRKKLVDLGYHGLSALLLLIAGVLYISSAHRIGQLNLYWKDKSYMKLWLPIKIFAGVLAGIQAVTYGVVAVLIFIGGTRHPVRVQA
ncbi:unnamed protein product [Orchesella dallaii]|uniref:Uncharacterized protein n=1 Tax=Orchesella dallaii TaxID=48710 RepID=A0ABP1RXG1_9HEXA